MHWVYRQNNSGGRFTKPAIQVVIEADTEEQANAIAKLHGVYFDGVNVGMDCSCCGDRWGKPFLQEMIPEPSEWVNLCAKEDRVKPQIVVTRR
jgi:hypothetical protein